MSLWSKNCSKYLENQAIKSQRMPSICRGRRHRLLTGKDRSGHRRKGISVRRHQGAIAFVLVARSIASARHHYHARYYTYTPYKRQRLPILDTERQGFFYTPSGGLTPPTFLHTPPHQFDLVTPVGSSLEQMHKIWKFCMKFGHLVLRKIN